MRRPSVFSCTGSLLGALLAATTPSCSRTEAPESSQATSAHAGTVAELTVPEIDTLRIATNTQATLDDVKIGAGNFRDEDHAYSEDSEKRGHTAGLWIYVRDDPTADKHIRVGFGSTFSAGRYDFKVVEVTSRVVTLKYQRRP